MAMFADFNGIKFEDYIDFYKHGQKWQNRMILGLAIGHGFTGGKRGDEGQSPDDLHGPTLRN